MGRQPANPDSVALRVAIIYGLLSLAWILFSDQIVDAISVDRTALTELQTLKGWVFVLLSAGIIFLLVRYHLRRTHLASQALQQREKSYANLVHNTPMAIWELDLSAVRRQLDIILRSSSADSQIALESSKQFLAHFPSSVRIQNFNQEAVRLTGATSPEQAVAHFGANLVDGTDPAIRDVLSRFYHGETNVQAEVRIRRVSGEQRSVLFRLAVAPESAATWERVIAIMVDITDRKEMEKRLNHRERMLSEAQRLGNLGAFDWDLVTGHLEWSVESHRIHGTNPRSFDPAYANFLELVHEEDRLRLQKLVEDSINQLQSSPGSKGLEAEYRVCRPDGQVRNILARSEIIYSTEGKPIRIIGIEQDITDRKQLSDFLETHNADLQQLVVVIQQLSCTRDITSLANLVSGAARQLVRSDGALFTLREGDRMRCVSEQAARPIFKGKTIPLNPGVSESAITPHQSTPGAGAFCHSLELTTAYVGSGISSIIAVPIRQEDPLGYVSAYWMKQHTANATELSLLQTLSDAAAVALSNIQTYQDLDAGHEAECESAEPQHGDLESQLRQSP